MSHFLEASDYALHLPVHHQLLNLSDGFGRVQPFRAGLGAVHDGVAAVELERVLDIIEPVAGCFVPAVDDPAVGMQQDGGAKVTLQDSTSS